MAQASTLTNEVRQRTTRLIEALYGVDAILSLVEDTATTDALRKAVFEQYLGVPGAPTTDITSTEFIDAVVALRSLRTWLVTNRPILAKLRI